MRSRFGDLHGSVITYVIGNIINIIVIGNIIDIIVIGNIINIIAIRYKVAKVAKVAPG